MLTKDRHPIMKRLADFEDSPLVPALLAAVHTESEKRLMDVSTTPLDVTSCSLLTLVVQTRSSLSRENDALSTTDARETDCAGSYQVRKSTSR